MSITKRDGLERELKDATSGYSLAKAAYEAHREIARNVVESQRLSTLIGYATAAPLAIGFLETALAIEDSSNGI